MLTSHEISWGKQYEYIDGYSRAAVYTRPLRLKPNAPEAFEILKAAAENNSQQRMREVMTDNARVEYRRDEANLRGKRELSSTRRYDTAQS